MKLLIAGSRSVNENDHMLVERALAESGLNVIQGSCLNIDEVVCGMARGADTLGRNWALNQGLSTKDMPADWSNLETPGAVIVDHWTGRQYNAKAGHDRNQLMVDYADAALFLWDGKSKGTADCIRRAKKKGIPLYIHQV